MKEEQVKALLSAAQSLGISPNEMKPDNPWRFKGPRAEAIQAMVAQQNPKLAAEWRVEAGESLSLGAIAARDGLAVMTQAQHQELLSLDPDYAAGASEAQARREADLLASLEKGAADLAAAREKQQTNFARSAGTNTTGGAYTKDFLRRIGGPQGLNRRASNLSGGN